MAQLYFCFGLQLILWLFAATAHRRGFHVSTAFGFQYFQLDLPLFFPGNRTWRKFYL